MIELMKDAATMAQMSLGERLTGALVVTGIGMGTTFAILVLLVLVVKLMKSFSGKKTEATGNAAPAPVATAQASPSAAVPSANQDAEIVAAITAAIAMMQGGKAFRIRNIAPAHNPTGWLAEGRSEAFASRRPRI